MELIALAISTIGGFILKYVGVQAHYRHQEMLDAMVSRAQADLIDGGQGRYTRRFIVLVMMSLLVFIVVAPALLDTNAIIVREGWFWTTTTEVKGIVYDDTIRLILVSIIGFYFGTSAASR